MGAFEDELDRAIEEVLMLGQLATIKNIDLVKRAAKASRELRDELSKWKEGCLVNADNAKDALRKSDNQRLDILKLQGESRAKDALVEKLVEAFERLWEEDEMGWIFGIESKYECVKCGARNKHGEVDNLDTIVHHEGCVQGYIHEALADAAKLGFPKQMETK